MPKTKNDNSKAKDKAKAKALSAPKNKKSKRRGQRTKYEYWITEEGLNLLAGWARDGLIDEEIAKKIGIARQTLVKWKSLYKAIGDTLKNGKEIVDNQVEQALLKRALGMKVTVRKALRLKDGEWHERVEYVDEEQYYPPDTTAQIFWLKNRRPSRWRNNDKEIDKGDNNDPVESSIHSSTLEALKNRVVPGFNDDEATDQTTQDDEGSV